MATTFVITVLVAEAGFLHCGGVVISNPEGRIPDGKLWK